MKAIAVRCLVCPGCDTYAQQLYVARTDGKLYRYAAPF